MAYSTVYDMDGDVLYLSKGHEAADHAIEDSDGTVWRYGSDGKLVGVTVLDWSYAPSEQRADIADAFGIPVDELLNLGAPDDHA